MSRWRRGSDPPPPAHPADALRAFVGDTGISPYGGSLLDADRWQADDDDEIQGHDDPDQDTDRDASADALAGELRLEVLRETGPLRWQASCPSAFPCSVPEGEGPGECRYRLPAEPVFGCTLAVAEGRSLTQGEVGQLLGVGRARAGELEGRALRNFRKAFSHFASPAELDAAPEAHDHDPTSPPAKLDSRRSFATLRGILARHGVISTAAPAMAHGPAAMSTDAELRELASLSKQLRAAVSRKGAR